MARGPKKHLKKVNTPCHWYQNKLSGIYAPRPSPGPHRTRECVPMANMIRDQLKFAFTYRECKQILGRKKVKVDQKVRTDRKFPLGLMDVLTIPEGDLDYRIMIDVKGRYKAVKISKQEATYKLLRVEKVRGGACNTVRTALTHDGRNVNMISKDTSHMDTLVFEFASNSVRAVIKFQKGCYCMVSAGKNRGRAGTLTKIMKHPGAVDLVELEDVRGNKFNTRLGYVFAIGANMTELNVTLPKGDGIKQDLEDDREERIEEQDRIREERGIAEIAA